MRILWGLFINKEWTDIKDSTPSNAECIYLESISVEHDFSVVGGVHSLHIFNFTLPLQKFFMLDNYFGTITSFLFLWERGGNKQEMFSLLQEWG